MPSLASVEQVRRLLARIASAAATDLNALLAMFSTGDRIVVSRILEDGWLALVEKYGTVAAEIGAAQFDQWASELGVAPRLQITTGVDPVRSAARFRWSMSTQDQIGNAIVLLDELVKQPFRSTMQKSAVASGAAWARVPTGPTTCAFCSMLASRGAVYHSSSAAGRDRKYHGDCDCVPTLVRGPADYPKGYDPTALYDVYDLARQNAGGGQAAEILSAMRQITGSN